jgi:large repetitive protein
VTVASIAALLLLSSVLVPTAAVADPPPVAPVISLANTVSPTPAQRSLNPGDTATYSFNVECSSLTTACDNFSVTDTIPAPLTLGVVAAPAGVHSTVTKSGNTFTVNFVDPLDDGQNGLEAGHQVGFTATALVPSTVSASYNGQLVTNTATATATNVPDPVTSTADVKLAVPTVLASTIGKSYSPSTVNSSPGVTSTIALTPTNTSNIGVDTLTVQEPADPTSAPNPFLYTAITGLTMPTAPGGANQVEVDWYDGTTWTAGSFKSTIGLPTGVAASSIYGLRFIFRKTSGTIAAAATGTVNIATALRSNVTSIPATTTVHNIASDFVTLAGTSTVPTTAPANLVITKVSINPLANKSYADANPVGGLATDEVTLGGANKGDYTLNKMVLTEPAAGDPTLADQGLGFTAWDNPANEWPVGATSETVEYLYAGAGGAFASGATVSHTTGPFPAMPVPDSGKTVTGFRVTFAGSMLPNQYANLHFTVTTPVVSADTTVTNTISLDVTTNDNQTAESLASAPLNLRTARINTSVSKTATPSSIYSSTGAATVLSLPAHVDPKPTVGTDHGGSTVGADELIVQDTATPASDAFWDSFNPAAIVATTVPSGVTLTVNAWNATTQSWVALDAATTLVVGPTSLTYVLTTSERANADGLQFVYTPVTGTLPPGFAVQPNIKAVLRATLRSDPGTAPNSTTGIVTVDNTVRSISSSTGAVNSPVQADNDASVQLLPIPSGGADLITKSWVKDPATGLKIVDARSGEQRTATLTWGTGSDEFNSVVVSDAAADPGATSVSSTVFDAFNLVKIPAITSAMDPFLTYDKVSSVQLYLPGTGWTDTATNPCAGTACDGTFPGYTLTNSESLAAIGVRLIYEESPTRGARFAASATAPLAGTGVAVTTDDTSRSLNLVFQVRDTRRSDGAPALGTTSGAIYNDLTAGLVLNSAEVDGRNSADVTVASGTASDAIQILDRPIDVTATKSWTDGPLGVPPDGTDQSFYPTAHLDISGTNMSVAAVDELVLAEPTGGDHPFDYVNMTKISSISFPVGSTQASSTVVISQDNGPSLSYSVADALALSASDLAHATGITVSHFGRIPTNGTTDVQLETQLRPSVRGTSNPVLVSPATSMTIHNTTTATITDPEVLTPASHTTSADAPATMEVDAYNYGVAATKSIVADTTSGATPAIQYDGSSKNATVKLSGQPTGNVPTTRMTIEDSAATFWNAYNFNGFGALTFAAPINRVEVDALVGGTWYQGTAQTTLKLPTTLPGGTTNADIRGLRFVFTKSDYSNWQRPHNPLQNVSFGVTRRTNLVSPSTSTVDDDLYTHTTPAPGETQVGVFSNKTTVTADAANGPTDTNPLWTASQDALAAISYQHLPADVMITKTPAGNLPLGSDIPYSIAITNTGSGHDKPLTGVVVTDTLPGTPADGPDLVLPIDPDTSQPLTLAQANQAFSYTMKTGGTTTTLSNTDVVAVMSPANADGTQNITFTLAAGKSIPLGSILTISTTLDFRTGLLAYTPVKNSATIISDQYFDLCQYTTDGATEPSQTDVASCTTTTTTLPLPSAPLTIVKGVRGDAAGPLDSAGVPLIDPATSAPYDDLGVLKTVTTSLNDCSTTSATLAKDNGKGFYTYPCVPITRPGGNEEWESQFTNGGNIDLDEIVAIDVLPAQNDTGVIIDSARGSVWTPKLTSYPVITGLPANASYVVEYTTTPGVATARCNGADIQNEMGMTASTDPAMLPAYRSCLTDTGAADDLPNRDWQTLSPTADASLLGSIVALKFDVLMGDGLAPGGSIDITYESQTANNIDLPETTANLGRDSIAYNSIAGAAIGRDDPETVPYPFVSEPRKVGVALATGGLNLRKLNTGLAATTVAPSTNKLNLACKSNGVPVQIFDSNGVARSPFTVTPGSPLLVEGLPLYSVCTVTEPTSYGQTSKTIVTTPVASSTVIAEAAHTTPSAVYNPHPEFDDVNGSHRPAIQESTVTNDYELSDFTVSKTIVDGGALDADGNSVAYNTPTFSVSCTFNNGTATPVPITMTPASFPLAGGTSRSYSVPAGSICVVKETDTQKAAATGYVVTTGTAAPTSGSTATATFTVAPNPTAPTPAVTPTNTVAFTNTYTTGSLLITKSIDGAGAAAWGGSRTFNLTVACTATNTTPTTVYSEAFTLSSPGNLTKTIDNLPTGAICTVAETDAAGATNSVVSGTATIVGGNTAPITVTNTYSDATLTVSKVINSSALDAASHPALENYAFPVSVDCTFQSAHVWGTGFTATPMTFTLQHDASRAISGLPAGANCVVTETDAMGADSSSIVTATTTGGATTAGTTASLTLTPDTTAATPVGTNTAIITNNYGVTTFTVTKVLAGAGATQFAASSFTVHVTCSAPGIPVSYDGDLTLSSPSNLSKTISNLADNSICSAVEQGGRSTTGADTVRELDSDGGTDGVGVLTTTASPASTTITNWYLTGEISVTKKVTGAGGALFGSGTDQFEINLTCTRTDVNGHLITVSIPGGSSRAMSDGDTATFTHLPSGASCSLRETDTGGASSTAILDDTNFQVSGDATTTYPLHDPITVDTSSLTDNQAQAHPSYTVVNSFDMVAFAITKSVDSPAVDQSGAPVTYGPFPVSVSCTFLGDPVYATGYSSATPMQKNLAEGATWNLGGLTTGTSCDVTETDSRQATGTSISVVTGTDPAVVTSGTSVTGIVLAPATGPFSANNATITNRYQAGTIVLSKVVTGAGRAAWGQGHFTINVTCTLSDGGASRTVWNKDYDFVDGDPAIQLDNVASGADCVATEVKTGGANSTAIALDGNAASVETTASFTSPAPNHNYDVVVTNRFDDAEVDVTKSRGGAGWSLYGDGPFEVTLSCTRIIDTVATAIDVPLGATRSLDASNSYHATYAGLPAGATCIPTETKTGGANSTVISPSMIVTDSSTPTDLQITNTFDVGSIAVNKTIAGDGSLLYGNGPFEVTLACTRLVNAATVDVDIPAGKTRELNAGNGYSNTFENLPAGALCAVTESKTNGATTSTFTTPSTGVAVVAGTATAVNLTNRFDIGHITVDNLVTGNDATRHLPDTYDVELTCTQEINGVTTPVDIPGGSKRDIWHQTSVSYEDLPIGATCSLIESVQNDAQTVMITWHGMPVPRNFVTVGDPDSVIHVVNVYNVALGFTGVEVASPLLFSLLALLIGLGIVVVQYVRRRRGGPVAE